MTKRCYVNNIRAWCFLRSETAEKEQYVGEFLCEENQEFGATLLIPNIVLVKRPNSSLE